MSTEPASKNGDDVELLASPLPVQFVVHDGAVRRQLRLDCHPEENIKEVKGRLAKRIGSEPEQLRVIFCGRALADEMHLSILALGPTTSLTVTNNLPSSPSSISSLELSKVLTSKNDIGQLPVAEILDEAEDWVKISDELTDEHQHQNTVDSGEFSSFHVFCKKCVVLERAKLRAYCRKCDSSAIIFKQEPHRWEDVADSNNIRVVCHSCDAERGVIFRFKCIKCNDTAAPLRHIVRNSAPSDCVICGSNSSPLGVRLAGCAHFACVECFASYGEQLLARMSMLWRPQVGYTIGCPVYGCETFVTDVHTLYLLGMPAYQHYQQMAAQMYFSAQTAERQRCPWPNCCAAFFVEETEQQKEGGENGKMLLCPECARMFCRLCCATDGTCKCAELRPDESVALIQRTTKNCPNCAAPTERAGGCSHIYCTQCQAEWCFICLKLWSDNCQWDHWFE